MDTQTVLKVFTIEKIISCKINFISWNCCVLDTVLDYSKHFVTRGPQTYVNTLNTWLCWNEENVGNGSVCFTYMIN